MATAQVHIGTLISFGSGNVVVGWWKWSKIQRSKDCWQVTKLIEVEGRRSMGWIGMAACSCSVGTGWSWWMTDPPGRLRSHTSAHTTYNIHTNTQTKLIGPINEWPNTYKTKSATSVIFAPASDYLCSCSHCACRSNVLKDKRFQTGLDSFTPDLKRHVWRTYSHIWMNERTTWKPGWP